MIDRHVHHIVIEQRDGVSYLTLVLGTGLRDACGRRDAKESATLVRYPTPIVATADIARAFNDGDSGWLRSDPAARDARQDLLQFLHEHAAEDGSWALMADDLRRFASLPLCAM
jgi:hypothetical protein